MDLVGRCSSRIGKKRCRWSREGGSPTQTHPLITVTINPLEQDEVSTNTNTIHCGFCFASSGPRFLVLSPLHMTTCQL